MKNNINLKNFTSTLIALIFALVIATSINYVIADFSNNPDAFPACDGSKVPGCNTPINVGNIGQAKIGALSVNAFTAYQNSIFKQDVNIDQLAVASSDRSVCADTTGKLYLCNMPGSASVSALYYHSLAVSGIAGYTQSPSPTTGTVSGTHSAFTGSISVTVVKDATGTTPPYTGVLLSVNGSTISCKLITPSTATSSAYTYPSRTYSLTDSIRVSSVIFGNSAPDPTSCN